MIGACWVDVEDGAGVKQGDGPIVNVLSWKSTSRLSAAGTFTLTVMASDPRASLLAAKRVVRCYGIVGGAVTEIGAGIVDSIRWSGANKLEASGSDLLAELRYRSVHDLSMVTETKHTPTKVFWLNNPTYTDLTETYDGSFGPGNRASFTLEKLNDFLYIGYSAPFSVLYTFQDAGSGSTIWNTVAADLNYGYSDGAGNWPELKVVSDTQIVDGVPWSVDLVGHNPIAGDPGVPSYDGENTVIFQRNANWTTESVNGVSAYWIRIDPTEDLQAVSIVEFVVGVRTNLDADIGAIMAFAPTAWADWDDDADSVTIFDRTTDGTYAAFAGELVLNALTKIAERSGESFRLGPDRTLHWLHTSGGFAASGIRAILTTGESARELDDSTCEIISIEQTQDSNDLITRIYPFGAGNGKARVTLVNADMTMPTGYTMDAANNYISNDDAETAYGQIERIMAFKDIRPTDDLTFDSVETCNQLAQITLNYLKRHSELNQFYTATVAGLSQMLLVGTTVHVMYREYYDGVVTTDIDDDLIILSETHAFSAGKLYTVSMDLGTTDSWPATDAEIVADMIEQGIVYESHPQAVASGMVKVI